MRQETFRLSQKELQRVSVINACIRGDMACARAAALLCLSVRQIKRLKKRMREDGEAALAHANRGRPSHRRLPDAVRERIVQLSRTTYAGFNDHHLCEKLVELRARSRNTAPFAAQERSRVAAQASCSRSSSAPRALRAARRTRAARRQPARLARRTRPAAHRSPHAG